MQDDEGGEKPEFSLDPLGDLHYLKNFDCDKPSLAEWLIKNGKRSHKRGAARVYILQKGIEVVGFITLSNGAVQRADYPKEDSAGLPPTVPAILIGRMGIHKDYQRQGIGTHLVADALEKIVAVSELSGVVTAYLHVDEYRALMFWTRLGFKSSSDLSGISEPEDPNDSEQQRLPNSIELYMSLDTIRNAIAQNSARTGEALNK